MAEIKSTLELIMERTRNLTLTEPEKESLQRKEATGRISGLVQKYQDGVIGVDILQSELNHSERTFPGFRRIMETALLEQLQPEGDNRKIWKALEQGLGVDTKPLKEVLRRFQEEMDRKKSKIAESLREELKSRGLSGSAVLPNLSGNEILQAELLKMQANFKKQLAAIRDN